ncbi:MAG: phospholipid carrier-dependent glycosyltransferase [bacterium]|nr:phospholipid carrier-dependent glycosyltransferase [bacterium]
MYLNFIKKNSLLLSVLLVTCIASFTYFWNYWKPAQLFWDENYYTASAQKYLDGVMFMEPHPPLGKMLIALGEYVIHPNTKIDKSAFVKTDYISSIPTGFSFAGFRFFPALFAMFTAPLFFLLLYQLSKRIGFSLLFSSLYLFENAFILQSRGAMVEGVQLFFIVLGLLYFVYLINQKQVRSIEYGVFGVIVGLALAIKVNSAILIPLYVVLFFYHNRREKKLLPVLFRFIIQSVIYAFSIGLIFFGIFYVHFIIGTKIVNGNYYKASEEYKIVLLKKETHLPQNFLIMIRDSLTYTADYEKGVPVYDYCKPGENGSLPITWPFGNKSINYRWEKSGESVRYLYLQGNPLIWLAGIIGIIFAVVLIIGKFIFGLSIHNRKSFFLITVFLYLYVTYMYEVSQVQRVLYLYHYFIPLIFSLLLFYLVIQYIIEQKKFLVGKLRLLFTLQGDYMVIGLLILFVILVVFIYLFFSPFTYYLPLTTKEFMMRNWFSFWKLTPIY